MLCAAMVLPSHVAVALDSAMVPGRHARRGGRRGGVCSAQSPQAGSALRRVLLGPDRWFALCLTVAVLPIAAAILLHSTLYSGWRHMYFIFPELVVVALFGIKWLFGLLRARRWPRRLLAGGLAALLAGQACWFAWMHPFEKFYLNPVGQSMCDLLERDYWYESTTAQIQRILEVDDSRRINLSGNAFVQIPVDFYLAEEDIRRLYIYYSSTYTEETPSTIS